MQLTESAPDGRPYIEAYGPTGFRIDGRRVAGAVLVLPDRALDWPVADPAAVDLAAFAPVVAAADGIEVLLYGGGVSAALPPKPVREGLRAHGVVIEPMATGAACRTYNVLVAEGRLVAAALLPV